MPVEKGGRLNLTEEQREARRQLARHLHSVRVVDPETGQERAKFGGPQTTTSAAKKTSDDLIQSIVDATKGEDVQVMVIDAYITALAQGSRAEKLRAARGLVEILDMNKKHQLAERRALDEQRRNALLGGILREIGASAEDEEEILDGEFSVEEPGGTGRDSSGVRELESGGGSAD